MTITRAVAAQASAAETASVARARASSLRRGPAAGYNMLVYLGDLWIYQQALRQGLAGIRGS